MKFCVDLHDLFQLLTENKNFKYNGRKYLTIFNTNKTLISN